MAWTRFTIILILIFSTSGLRIFCAETGPVKKEITPPVVESKIGFISFPSETEIEPGLDRIFIAPQTRLPIMLDAADYYLLIVRIESYAVCCMIPKYQKYMVLMEPSKDGFSMYFRGGIEASLVPFILRSGEELPVTGSDDKAYFAAVKRNNSVFTIKVPRDTDGLSLSRESSFAKFAVGQKRKGLEYFNGKWIPSAEAAALRDSQVGNEKKKQERWNNLKAEAEAGVLVLKNGRIMHGSYKGCDKISILFESGGETRQYGVEEVADIGVVKALSMGNLDSAGQLIAKARDLAGAPGQAKRDLEQAQGFLRKINPSVTELMGRAMELGAEATKINDEIDSSLKEKNLALYNFEVFPKTILDYHLKNGHIRAGGTWINPDQLCRRCSGGGEIACAKCQATGKVAKKCQKCQNGRITCHICEGSGYKVCSICNGAGQFIRTCSYCGGSGVVSGYYSYPCGSNVYLFSGAVMVVGGYSPWYCYPSYTAKTCPACNGTGNMSITCTYCGGYGKMICPKTEKCDLCNGVGFIKSMCPDCEGRGKVTCPDCKGKGFSGNAQKAPDEDDKAPAPAGNAVPAGGGKSQKMAP